MTYARLFASLLLTELFKPAHQAFGYLTQWSGQLIRFGEKLHPDGPPSRIDNQLDLLKWAVGNLDGHTFVEGTLTYLLGNGNSIPIRLVPDLHRGVRIDWSDIRRRDMNEQGEQGE